MPPSSRAGARPPAALTDGENPKRRMKISPLRRAAAAGRPPASPAASSTPRRCPGSPAPLRPAASSASSAASSSSSPAAERPRTPSRGCWWGSRPPAPAGHLRAPAAGCPWPCAPPAAGHNPGAIGHSGPAGRPPRQPAPPEPGGGARQRGEEEEEREGEEGWQRRRTLPRLVQPRRGDGSAEHPPAASHQPQNLRGRGGGETCRHRRAAAGEQGSIPRLEPLVSRGTGMAAALWDGSLLPQPCRGMLACISRLAAGSPVRGSSRRGVPAPLSLLLAC